MLGNPTNFSFYVIDANLRPTAAFDQIKDLPKACDRTAEIVCSVLLADPLFEFMDFRVETVTGESEP